MAIYVSGDIVPVHDTSGVTAWAAGNNMQNGVWTTVLDFGPTSDGSTSISQTVNTGEWYGAFVSLTHNDDNALYENELWFSSGDYYAVASSSLGTTGDGGAGRISAPAIATSNGVRTITVAATGLTAGSWVKCWVLRFR